MRLGRSLLCRGIGEGAGGTLRRCVVSAVLSLQRRYRILYPPACFPSFARREPTMLTMLGSRRRCCDGLTRRETLRVGALSLLGGAFNLPSLLALERSRSSRPGKAKSVILLYLMGGAA